MPSHFHPAMVKIGFSGSYNLGGGGYFSNDGEITFNGKATFSRGIQLITNRECKIIFGNQFRCNSNCIINSGERILFADDVLLSWNVTIIDGDGHRILPEVEDRPNRISVGKHVWICANVTILKGTSIQNNVVVSSNAIVSKKLREDNVIIGGVNQIIKRDIN